jgi:site-specific DNA-methyltransferase (adenine-specific)
VGDDMTYKRKEIIGDYTLYLGDSYHITAGLGRFDAIVADPPYGIGYKPQKHNSSKSFSRVRNFGPKDQLIGDSGNMDFDPTPFMGLSDKHIWWGANYYANKLDNAKGWLVWYKARGMEATSFSCAEMAWTNLPLSVRGLDYRWMGLVRDGALREKALHPTQKPLAVMEWCLGFLPNARTILDPFMGSGTTLVACAKMGRQGVGIELDPDYFDISCKRVEDAYRQPDMFVKVDAPILEKQEALL